MTIEAAALIVQGGQDSGPWVAGAIGVIGAVAGSSVSVLWTEWFNRRTRARDDKRRGSVASHSILHKMINMYSVSLKLQEGFHEAGIKMEEERQQAAAAPDQFDENGALLVPLFFLCLYIQSYASRPPLIEFNIDELWFLPKIGGDKLLNELTGLDRTYNAMVQSFESYGEERRRLIDRTRVDMADGARAITFVPPDEVQAHNVMMASLDEMLDQIGEMADEVIQKAFAGLTSLAQAKTQPLGRKFELSLLNSEGEEVTIRAADGPAGQRKWFELWKSGRRIKR